MLPVEFTKGVFRRFDQDMMRAEILENPYILIALADGNWQHAVMCFDAKMREQKALERIATKVTLREKAGVDELLLRLWATEWNEDIKDTVQTMILTSFYNAVAETRRYHNIKE